MVGAPTVPPALPSRNFRITGRTFHARIYGSGTHPRDPLCTFYLVRRRPCSGKTFSSQAHPKSSTGRIWSGRPPSHPRFPLETFKIQAEPSMTASMARTHPQFLVGTSLSVRPPYQPEFPCLWQHVCPVRRHARPTLRCGFPYPLWLLVDLLLPL